MQLSIAVHQLLAHRNQISLPRLCDLGLPRLCHAVARSNFLSGTIMDSLLMGKDVQNDRSKRFDF
ncbi:MAG TPA: hypothetical protein DEF45_18910 [Rhodopirellula sp.]|nr:hypothetical protein [Rhodopirellula sp.]